METLPRSPVLACLLADRRREIESAWIDLLGGLSDSHYQLISDEELASWTAAGLGAVIEGLRQGSKEPLVVHAMEISRIRSERGFEINEVVEGLLLLREAARQHLLPLPLGEVENRADPLAEFDLALRILIAELAKRFAEVVNESLRQERDRTAYLLDATGAAGESLDLSVVMPTVARSIKNALGYSHCSIYLWNEAAGVFSACAAAGEIDDPRLAALVQRSCNPRRNRFAADALSAQEISTHRSVSGVHFGDGSDSKLDVSAVVVLPIRLVDRLLAFALALDTGSERDFDSHALVLAAGIAKSVAPAVDNAHRYTETRRLLAESRNLQRAVESLLEMQGLEDVMKIICREAEGLSGSNGSALFLGEEGAISVMTFKHGSARALADEELLSSSAENRLTTVLPLEVRGHTLGTLVLVGERVADGGDISRLAAGFADQAAIAIQHAFLHRQQEELAALEERQKLARDLHDSVSQSIYSVTMQSAAATRLVDSGQVDRAVTVLGELHDTALDALREMRLLVFEMRPPLLEKQGLVAALEARLAAVEARSGLLTEFVAESDFQVPARTAEALYGIATEALNNVLKHAEASRVSARLTRNDEVLVLEILDDGVGLVDEQVRKKKGGLGLQSMRERANEVGGRLKVSGALGQGTSVRVEVPRESVVERFEASEVVQ